MRLDARNARQEQPAASPWVRVEHANGAYYYHSVTQSCTQFGAPEPAMHLTTAPEIPKPPVLPVAAASASAVPPPPAPPSGRWVRIEHANGAYYYHSVTQSCTQFGAPEPAMHLTTDPKRP